MSEHNNGSLLYEYYLKQPLGETHPGERKDLLKVYCKHRYYGALIVCTVLLLIGLAAVSAGPRAMLLYRIGSFLIITALTWFVLSLVRYLKAIISKSGDRIFIREYRQINFDKITCCILEKTLSTFFSLIRIIAFTLARKLPHPNLKIRMRFQKRRYSPPRFIVLCGERPMRIKIFAPGRNATHSAGRLIKL